MCFFTNKLSGKTGFTVTRKDRAAYVTQLQALIFAAEGAKANDLTKGDSGCGADQVVRKHREPTKGEGGGSSAKRKRAVEMDSLDLGDGHVWTWPVTQVFAIERILNKRMVPCKIGTARLAEL